MRQIKIYFFIFSFLLLVINTLSAQEGTRNTATSSGELTGKIILIPFEPKLYMSEIDMKINQQTTWNFEQIRENFRHQLDAQLKSKLQSIGSVISFYSDSTKMYKDLNYMYKSTRLAVDLVDKPSQSNDPEKKQSGIKNGQIQVEMNNDKKFMTTKVNDNEVLPFFINKYKSEYFVFVNELDIKSVPDSYVISTDSYLREVSVHYTIIDKSGKTISAGLLSSRFSSKENNPKKIVAACFVPIATTISTKLSDIINPKSATPKK